MAYLPEDLNDSGQGTDPCRNVEDLFDAASDLPREDRAAFLNAHCGSQPSIRAEVERLLFYHDQLGLLDSGPVARLLSGAKVPFESPTLSDGMLVADRFRVVRLIGSGGMGEVYEAEDLTIGIPVALKTIRGEAAADARLTARFRKELLLARDVSHPNVCKVFEYWDLEQEGGRFVFFTMELLKGETLSRRIASAGPLKPKEALRILWQVAAGLGEVHRLGIVHRDLKPSNIFLVAQPEGYERAVVMDFGLARTVRSGVTQTATKALMGTPTYMAPELFDSETITVAADVYSFGVTAFETVTGANSPLVAPRSVTPGLGPEWDYLLRCFKRNPEERPAAPMDVVAAIERGSRRWRRLAVKAGVLVVLTSVVAIAAWNQFNSAVGQARTTTQITFDRGFTADPSSSADGQLLVYSSDRGSKGDLNVWLQRMDTGQTRQLTDDPGDEADPAISRDGKLLAYYSKRIHSLMLKPLDGGPEREIAKWGDNPQFSPDGKMLAYWTGHPAERTAGQTWIVLLPAGTPRRLVADFADARFPAWAPDGRSILLRGTRAATPVPDPVLEWWLVDIATGNAHATAARARLKAAGLTPHDSPSLWDGSRVVFSARGGHSANLWSLNLSWLFQRTWGSPVPFTNGAGLQDAPAHLADGRIAYASWRERIHIWKINAVSSDLTELTFQDSMDTRVSASRDGNVIVFGRRLGEARNVWMKDLRTGSERELAANELAYPFVSPDGSKVAFFAGTSIRLLNARTGEISSVCADCGELLGWMPDQSGLLYLVNPAGEARSIAKFDLATRRSQVLVSGAGLREASVAPDGSAIAFTVRKPAMNSRIFVAILGGDGFSPKWSPITQEDGWAQKPVWTDDGRTIVYDSTRDGFECIWKQKVEPGSFQAAGEPKCIRHFHMATFKLSHLTTAAQALAQARGDVFLSVDSAESNIWAVQPGR